MNNVNWEEFREAFRAELEDHVRSLNQQLLHLERSGAGNRSDLFDGLFRDAHSLKGAARSIGLQNIEQIAHGLESALDDARKRGDQPTGSWFDAVYQAMDTLLPLNGPDAASGLVDVPGTLAALEREIVLTRGDTGFPPPPLLDHGGGPNGASPQSPPARTNDAEPLSGTPGSTEAPPQSTPRTEPRPESLPPTATTAQVRNGQQAKALPLQTVPPARDLPGAPDGAPLLSSTVVSHIRPPGDSGRAAPAAVVAPPAEAALRGGDSDSIRVGIKKLDALLAQAGELSVARIRVEQRLRDVRSLAEQIDLWRRSRRRVRALWMAMVNQAPPSREMEALRRHQQHAEDQVNQLTASVQTLLARFRSDVTELGVVTQTISEEVIKARLLPAITVLGPFERMVRDLGRVTAKEVDLVIDGAETEVDRKILEQLRDPIMHMLRNAVDHGIEAPGDRAAAGKPRVGTIALAVFQEGDMIAVVVKDDGRGLDPNRLRASAVGKGLIGKHEADEMDDRAALDLIFRPGFSTSPSVTATSGRGVGMDVVRENLAHIDGRIDINSTPGVGTIFTLWVPLSVVTTRAVLAEVGDTIFAIPTHAIERLVRMGADEIRSFEGRQAVAIDGEAVACTPLGVVLGIPKPANSQADARRRPGIVVRHGDRRVVLLVDALPGEQELVVKALRWPLRRVRHVSGAAVLDTGATILVLDAGALVRTSLALLRRSVVTTASAAATETARAGQRRILVVDDSATTRTLERSILESAGYQVVVAGNGIEALRQLKDNPADLVVSDVDMPLMDGFGLTTEIRRDDRLRQIPVILVTSLEAREYRERGLAAGADAYIVKSAFDQGLLLDTIGSTPVTGASEAARPVRVLVVDDSETARASIVWALDTDPRINVVGTASNGRDAIRLAASLKPDVIAMDVQMPVMDGIETSRQIMEQTPTPIVLLAEAPREQVLRMSPDATRAGALAIVSKPTGHPTAGRDHDFATDALRSKVTQMAYVKLVRRWPHARWQSGDPPRAASEATPSGERRRARPGQVPEIIAIGSSTGGPQALREILAPLASDFPAPIVVVQHIAHGFTTSLLNWLRAECLVPVRIAEGGEAIVGPGIFLAPNDAHLEIRQRRVVLSSGPTVSGHRPSATVLFSSVARDYGPSAVGILLTGMGDDGSVGLGELYRAGATTIAQDEASSVVFSMPAAAIGAGFVDRILPPTRIAELLRQLALPGTD